MEILIRLALLGWFPLTLVLFMVMPPRRAILFSFVGGMILLPAFATPVPGLPGFYGRAAAVAMPCLFGILFTDLRALTRLRLVATDLAMACLLVVPFITSTLNGLGSYDGGSQVYGHLIIYGLPYLFGRIYFGNSAGVKAVVVAIIVGGILLAPLALWEIRMSPQLHAQIYGAPAVSFFQFARFGGYRPIVFFPSPLMLTFVFTAASLCAGWLGHISRNSHFQGIRYAHWTYLLVVTTLLGKTFGAITLMLVGGALLWISGRTRRAWILLAFSFAAFLYPAMRVTQTLEAGPIMAVIEPIFPAAKVETFGYRIVQEDLFAAHAMKRPWFGWGGWGRNRTDETKSIDGLWIVMFSKHGIAGVSALLFIFAIPVFRVWRRMPRRGWRDPTMAPVAVMTLVIVLFWIDCMLNAFVNPIYMLAMGALATWRPDPAAPPAPSPEADATEAKPVADRVDAGPRFIDLKRRSKSGGRDAW